LFIDNLLSLLVFLLVVPLLVVHMTQQVKDLAKYVRSEFEEYLKCSRLEHGFLRVRCESCHCEDIKLYSQQFSWEKKNIVYCNF